SSVVRTFSRTRRRAHSLRRLRRGLTARSSCCTGDSASSGTTRTVGSIGRPYLMAMGLSLRREPHFYSFPRASARAGWPTAAAFLLFADLVPALSHQPASPGMLGDAHMSA